MLILPAKVIIGQALTSIGSIQLVINFFTFKIRHGLILAGEVILHCVKFVIIGVITLRAFFSLHNIFLFFAWRLAIWKKRSLVCDMIIPSKVYFRSTIILIA